MKIEENTVEASDLPVNPSVNEIRENLVKIKARIVVLQKIIDKSKETRNPINQKKEK